MRKFSCIKKHACMKELCVLYDIHRDEHHMLFS